MLKILQPAANELFSLPKYKKYKALNRFLIEDPESSLKAATQLTFHSQFRKVTILQRKGGFRLETNRRKLHTGREFRFGVPFFPVRWENIKSSSFTLSISIIKDADTLRRVSPNWKPVCWRMEIFRAR